MSEQNKSYEQQSTPNQAQEVFSLVAELTALQGSQHKHTSAYGEEPAIVPSEIAVHFPAIEDDSHSASRSVYIAQELDSVTGQPRRDGVVANVAFIQKEKRDDDLGYSTNVNYHVVAEDGIPNHLERHVTTNEFGRAAVAKQAARRAMGPVALLNESKAIKSSIDETRDLENATGLHDVSFTEAEQISTALRNLQSK